SARDARVRSLIDNTIDVAAVKRTAPPIVEGWETAQAKDGKEQTTAATLPRVTPLPAPDLNAPAPGSTDPIKPNAVKTFTVHPGPIRTASLSPLPSDSRRLTPAPATANPASVTNIATIKSDTPAPPTPGAKPSVLGVLHTNATKVASAGDSV